MKRCLDSTFLSDLVRGVPAALDAAERWARDGDELTITSVSRYEVLLGIELERSESRREQWRAVWERFAASLPLIPLEGTAAALAATRQAALIRKGRRAAVPDLFIAAAAASQGCDVVVTDDRDDFDRIGLVKAVRP